MKIEKILEYEAQNNDTVILFKEGIFLRAYERSAMRFTEHIAPFKVFKKFYKIVNAEVCYLGFPMKRQKRWIMADNVRYLPIKMTFQFTEGSRNVMATVECAKESE